jgi:dTDP-4-dehydrorhamnose 3,5-epimerase
LPVQDEQNAMNKQALTVRPAGIPDVLLLQPAQHKDARGVFLETYRKAHYQAHGIETDFVQDNLVRSVKNVFRGLHFQLKPFEQAKLITMIEGEILDVVLDLRQQSPYFLQSALVTMHAQRHEQLYIPAGFAHGYYVLSDTALISYKVSKPYAPQHQAGISWSSPELELSTVMNDPLLSGQDKSLPLLEKIIHDPRFLF